MNIKAFGFQVFYICFGRLEEWSILGGSGWLRLGVTSFIRFWPILAGSQIFTGSRWLSVL